MQVSTRQFGPRPAYISTLQFIVPMDPCFFRYLSSTFLALEVNQVYGFDWAEIGRASLPLPELKREMRLDTRGVRPRQRNLRVSGPGGSELGTLTVRTAFACV